MSQITLTAAMRANLVSLQGTSELMGRTQERLATGLKVNSAVDNPTNYFAARAHNERANLLNGLKDYISEAIQTVKAADKGVKAITSSIESLRSIVNQAREAINDTVNSGTLLNGLASQYNEVVRQLNNFQRDASYKGVNFLTGSTTLTVNFNENATTSLVMNGFNATAVGLNISGGTASGLGSITSGDMDTAGELNGIENTLNAALATLRVRSSELASNLSVLTYRQTFITDMVNTLKDGATKLTVADTNEEGANMLMLQTRQQLGVTSLSLASQAAQSVLRLF